MLSVGSFKCKVLGVDWLIGSAGQHSTVATLDARRISGLPGFYEESLAKKIRGLVVSSPLYVGNERRSKQRARLVLLLNDPGEHTHAVRFEHQSCVSVDDVVGERVICCR